VCVCIVGHVVVEQVRLAVQNVELVEVVQENNLTVRMMWNC